LGRGDKIHLEDKIARTIVAKLQGFGEEDSTSKGKDVLSSFKEVGLLLLLFALLFLSSREFS